jgi:hypothetical protein
VALWELCRLVRSRLASSSGSYDGPVTTPPNAPQPGEQRPPGSPPPPPTGARLERPPGERYSAKSRPERDPHPAPRSLARGALGGFGVAGVGVLVIAVLGLVELSLGLVALAGGIGWAVGEAVRWGAGTAHEGRTERSVLSGTLAAMGVVVGLLGVWGWARVEGGVLDPIAYLGERYGLLAPAMVAVGAVLGAARAR